ncbi:hypothetical protein ISN44_As01g052610 [Arabidopsis suecica]|uniref:Uncharacterized protein n=1 Tax=Arabidopsis suecica TaxID=45249 RepID=A0A8T2HFU5_ARASU|nr:hypothetical protein ISN44_As01g052610 [Arabidopsis suecica]
MKCYSKSLLPVSFQFLAARCRCPWATLTPRSHSGQPRRIHAFQRSTPIQPRRDKGSHFVHHPWPAIEQPDSHQKMVAKNIFVTFLAARCRCPWATLTPRSHSGQPRRIHAFQRSTPIQPRRVESMPMGTSRYFVRKTTIPPPKRPRRIHVSPCHDTPILFGDEVERCPWGHLGNIMRTSYIPPPTPSVDS